MIAAEASLINEWRHARTVGDTHRATELANFLHAANRSLVERAARQVPGVQLEDARQTAAVALFRALEGFDGSRRVPFAAYASYWFRKESQRARASHAFGTSLPAHRIANLAQHDTPSDAVLRGLARPTPLEPDDHVEAQGASVEELVLDTLTAATVRQQVARLAELTQRVLELRYGLDGGGARSNRAVAAILGVSEFTVRTHLSRGLRTLRTRLP